MLKQQDQKRIELILVMLVFAGLGLFLGKFLPPVPTKPDPAGNVHNSQPETSTPPTLPDVSVPKLGLSPAPAPNEPVPEPAKATPRETSKKARKRKPHKRHAGIAHPFMTWATSFLR